MRKHILAGLIAAPVIMALVTYVVLSRIKKDGPIIATAAQLANTKEGWNSLAGTYLDVVAESAKIELQLRNQLESKNLTEPQVTDACQRIPAIIKSLKTGDYNLFIGARLPRPPTDEFTPEMQAALKKFAQQESGTPLDYYREIWTKTFSGNPLFTRILMGEENVLPLLEVEKAVPSQFEFPPITRNKDSWYLSRFVTTAFDYESRQSEELRQKGRIQILRFFFMGECSEPEGRRPFMLCLFWDSGWQVWLPVRFSHGSVGNPSVVFRFF